MSPALIVIAAAALVLLAWAVMAPATLGSMESALEVEDAWTRKFTVAAGTGAAAAVAAVTAATAGISWYPGSNPGDLGSVTQAIGSSLSSQIASCSGVPGSSSGGGGGGCAR